MTDERVRQLAEMMGVSHATARRYIRQDDLAELLRPVRVEKSSPAETPSGPSAAGQPDDPQPKKGMTPAERRLRAQIASNESWANTEDRTRRTQPGRDAMWKKFEDQVDPDRKLTPKERTKRAENARKAHYQRLALKSAQTRRRRKGSK